MFVYSSRYPDRSEWQQEDDYRFDLRNDLYASHADIQNDENSLRSHFHAYERLTHYDEVRVSVHQRIATQRVKALFLAAIGESKRAVTALQQGIAAAHSISDYGAVVDLLSVRASIHQSVLHLRAAASDIERFLTILDDERTTDAPLDAAMTLSGLVRLAGLRFYLAQYLRAEELLAEARRLLVYAPSNLQEAATIEWTQANLERWRGSPERALRHASAAASVFSESPNLGNVARVQALVADAALDYATTFAADWDRDYQVRFARSHIRLARAFATEDGGADDIGQGMIQLTLARYSRLSGSSEDRVGAIERVADLARQRKDDALLAQAVTALGDELTASGERERGRNLYRSVLHLLHGSDVPALVDWARRPLLIASEFEV